MKRTYRFLAVAVSVLLLAGCQPTPEQSIVIQKDLEQMISQAQSTPETSAGTLAERLGAPGTYTVSLSGADGRLIVSVDAAISVPDAAAIPIYRVQSAGFSEEFSDRVYQLLCGDTDMYAASEAFTKDAIMEEILAQRQQLASGELDEEARASTEAYIAQLETEYQTAPDTMGTPVTSVTFQTRKEYGASYTVFEVRENEAGQGGKYFTVRNDTQYQTEAIQSVDGETVAPRSNAHLTFYDADIGIAEPYELREVMGEAQTEALETTPIQAQAMAQELLDKIGVGNMEIYSICLVANEPQAATQYGYKVRLRCTVEGVCVNSPEYCTFVDDPSYGCEWKYGTFDIGISDAGVYSFE